MSRGLGWVQQECLRVLADLGEATTFTVVAEVYKIEPDENGNRMCDDTQHTAVKRALRGLRQKRLVASSRDMRKTRFGGKTDRAIAAEIGVSVTTMRRARMNVEGGYANAERCSLWKLS